MALSMEFVRISQNFNQAFLSQFSAAAAIDLGYLEFSKELV
jgi:hypothetical protein